MSNPFEGTATLEMLIAIERTDLGLLPELKPRREHHELIGQAPEIVARICAYREQLRDASRSLVQGTPEHQCFLDIMAITSNMIQLELRKRFPDHKGPFEVRQQGEIIAKFPRRGDDPVL